MPNGDRRFDVVLWGATGFTGRLVAEYLVTHHGAGAALRWAIGGRSRAKLEEVRSGLTAIDKSAAELPIVVGDGADRDSLDAIVKTTRAVCSTVGPFAVHGKQLVAACVEAGTDYCDSTGEPQFVRAMIDAHHERARATGARIVHCCGFDSIPSDLGTLMVQEHAREADGGRCYEVRHTVSLRGGGLSGGTVASMMQIMDEASRDPAVREVLEDPYSLDPRGEGSDPEPHEQRGVHWDPDTKRWTAPFVMAAINARVVRRSNAVLGYAWGRDFRYREALSFGSGARGWMQAAGVATGVAAALGAMAVPQIRHLAAGRLPSPGEGPSREARARSSFVSRFVGVLEGSGRRLHGVARGGDPGYEETAKMLGESVLCLVRDRESTRQEGGVLTPASCLGMTLVGRLRKAGLGFEMVDGGPGD
jgi:short subunit dehydrogenase-like uncharacterized protein